MMHAEGRPCTMMAACSSARAEPEHDKGPAERRVSDESWLPPAIDDTIRVGRRADGRHGLYGAAEPAGRGCGGGAMDGWHEHGAPCGVAARAGHRRQHDAASMCARGMRTEHGNGSRTQQPALRAFVSLCLMLLPCAA